MLQWPTERVIRIRRENFPPLCWAFWGFCSLLYHVELRCLLFSPRVLLQQISPALPEVTNRNNGPLFYLWMGGACSGGSVCFPFRRGDFLFSLIHFQLIICPIIIFITISCEWDLIAYALQTGGKWESGGSHNSTTPPVSFEPFLRSSPPLRSGKADGIIKNLQHADAARGEFNFSSLSFFPQSGGRREISSRLGKFSHHIGAMR